MLSEYTPLYVLAVYGLVRFFVKAGEGDKSNRVNWSPLESVGVSVVLYLGSQLVAYLALYAYAGLKGISVDQFPNWLKGSVIAQFILILLVEFLVVWGLKAFLGRRKASLKTIGLIKPKVRDIGWTLTGFAIYFVLFIAISLAAKSLIPFSQLV